MASPLLFVWQRAVIDVNGSLTSTERLVALVLGVHMDVRKGVCWPAVLTIALEAGLGRSTVQRALRGLVKKGYLRRKASSGRTTNRYTALIPESNRPAPTDTVPQRETA